jgi:hypothetical protein
VTVCVSVLRASRGRGMTVARDAVKSGTSCLFYDGSLLGLLLNPEDGGSIFL